MESNEFKLVFGEVAKEHGFASAHGGWYLEASAALFVLSLQKSNYGKYFELNMKLFLGQPLLEAAGDLRKFIKDFSGDIFRRQPEEYRDVFDLESKMPFSDRRCLLDTLFNDVVDAIAVAAATPSGILQLRDAGVVYVLPAAEKRLIGSLAT